ncbi:hypothetical protein BGZ60DRAFT_18580 [Tricladium varicosporioides]|nr:hypothetical protein BGZ60DRAFT_18580 [Hymenoscyphus varicosporioides]
MLSSPDSSYASSEERHGRSREAHPGEPRKRGHTVSPSRQDTPPPSRPGTEPQPQSSSTLEPLLGSRSIDESTRSSTSWQSTRNLSADHSYDLSPPYQPPSTFGIMCSTGMPSSTLEPLFGSLSIDEGTRSSTSWQSTRNLSADHSYDLSPPYQPPSTFGVSAKYSTGMSSVQQSTDSRQYPLEELKVLLGGKINLTAVMGASSVSLISEELASELVLDIKSIETIPRLHGKDSHIKPTGQAYVKVQNNGKGRKERVYIVPKSQRLRERLILTKSTMHTLLGLPPLSSKATSDSLDGYAAGSYAGYSQASQTTYAPMTSSDSPYIPTKTSSSSYGPENPVSAYTSSSAYAAQDSKTTDMRYESYESHESQESYDPSYESKSKRSSGRDHHSKHKHRKR